MKNYMSLKHTARAITFIATLALALLSFNSHAADSPRFSAQTSMALILDNPDARAIMAKYLPAIMADPQIDGARVISLGELATYIPADLTPEVMTKLLADLNNLAE